jgi:hypothetical protein
MLVENMSLSASQEVESQVSSPRLQKPVIWTYSNMISCLICVYVVSMLKYLSTRPRRNMGSVEV